MKTVLYGGEGLRYLFIGTVEQLDLSIVLRRLETHTKTGLLVVKQETRWIEFYFRNGQLVCIGPLRTSATLAERLVQAKVISSEAAQDAVLHTGSEPATEMRLALTLMDLGHVSREELRAWATEKAVEVLRIVLAWSQGEIHFAEEAVPPAGRLLVGMSITSLLDSLHTEADVPPEPIHQSTVSNKEEEVKDILHLDKQTPPPAPVFISPSIARHVDPSSMQPEMVLMPSKLSDQYDQSRSVTLTPQQWRVLTCVNGYTSLQGMCQELSMPPAALCQIAAGLMDEGLLYAVDPTAEQSNTFFPAVGEVGAASLNSSYAISDMPMRPRQQTGSFAPAYMLATISAKGQLQLSKDGLGATFRQARAESASAQPDAPAPAPSNAAYAVAGSGS